MIEKQSMLPIGSTLRDGTYRVVRYIASGGFGNTYEVEHLKLGKNYCMKEFFMRGINLRQNNIVTVSIEENRSSFEQMRKKFFQEAKRMAHIENAHIVDVTDCFEENRTAYYVMKLINGQSLSAMMTAQGHPFSEKEVRTMLPSLLMALRCVHKQGLYHLDLKSANIMMGEKKHLWLIDFGASKQMSAEESHSLSFSSSPICYTIGYAPPEQVEGDTKRIGPWTDFYALGATLYNLLSNQKPPELGDVKYEREKAFHFPPAISNNMQELILWLMQPDYFKRPQTVEEIEKFLTESNTPIDENYEDTVFDNEEEPTKPINNTISQEIQPHIINSQETKGAELKGKNTELSKPNSAKARKRVILSVIAAIILLLILIIGSMLKRYSPVIQENDEIDSIVVINPYADLCPDNNHPHSIDLGLPSGTMWACCNVGADDPGHNGGFYSWGETSEKDTYNWLNYQHRDQNTSRGIFLGWDISDSEYDVAKVKWGEGWNMPTIYQLKELIDNTTFQWWEITYQNAIISVGARFIGSNGNKIFFPAAGSFSGNYHGQEHIYGYYWSSNNDLSDTTAYSPNTGLTKAYALDISDKRAQQNTWERYLGISVRPVYKNYNSGRGIQEIPITEMPTENNRNRQPRRREINADPLPQERE